MFADPLTISPDAPTRATTNNVTWDVNESLGKMRKRLNAATSIQDSPEYLVMNHFTQGSEKDGTLADRHLLQLSRVERDTAGKPFTSVLNVTLLIPRNALFSTADITRQFNLAANFLADTGNGRLAAFIAGQS